jgi:hypothetical protein
MVEVLVYWSNILIIYYLHYFAALLLKIHTSIFLPIVVRIILASAGK